MILFAKKRLIIDISAVHSHKKYTRISLWSCELFIENSACRREYTRLRAQPYLAHNDAKYRALKNLLAVYILIFVLLYYTAVSGTCKYLRFRIWNSGFRIFLYILPPPRPSHWQLSHLPQPAFEPGQW